MRDLSSMTRAAAGARYLFHVAADYRLWARDPEDIVRNNLEGTRTTMQAALAAQIERIVYTSSVATLKPIAGFAADETSRHDAASAIGAYKRSKVVAERLVEDMIVSAGLAAVIVHPSTPIGPRDVKPTPTGQIIVEAASGRMPAFLDTGLNLVHVDDVADGHLLALERGRIGQSYVLGGEDVSLKTMLAVIAELTGRRAPGIELPRLPLYPLAYAAEIAATLTGKEPFLTVDALKMAKHHMFFSSAKAAKELGYRARPFAQGIADAIVWFRQAGILEMMQVWLALCVLSFVIWIYLLVAHGGFWLARERNDANLPAPGVWPTVTAVVPARNEADVIARTIGSLLQQDYPGPFRVILVDDQSTDETAAIAKSLGGRSRLDILNGSPCSPGWTGKLWAVAQGVAYAKETGATDYLWLTDADIAHAPDNLRMLAARAENFNLVLVSEMAKLHCGTWTERFLIPAFVFFFDMLYPFAWVNDPRNKTAAAAGGSMLVRREALEAAGGIAAIRREIIDDCALARLMKAQGGIWLGLTELAQSIRPYENVGEIGRMVSRSAYAQLQYSPILLAGTVAGMLLLYAVPPIAALDLSGPAGLAGLLAWFAMVVSFQPILRFYRVSPLWGIALPVIGLVYTAFTFDSALQFWRGRGGMWKGRAQAMTKG